MNKLVFISHSKNDKPIADRICGLLEDAGIECWIAPRDIPYGEDWAGEITSAIKSSKLFLFILSKNSNASRQCPKEISIADNADIPIITIKTDDAEMNPGFEYHLSMHQILQFDFQNEQLDFDKIKRAVSEKIQATPKNHEHEEEKDFEKELEVAFDKLFANDSSENSSESSFENSRGKLGDILVKNFMNAIQKGISDIATSKEEKAGDTLPDFSLSGELLKGKHFSIPERQDTKTLVYRIKKVIDYSSMSSYTDLELLEKIEEFYGPEHSRMMTYFIDDVDEENGESIVILHIQANGVVLVNSGILDGDVLKVSKAPTIVRCDLSNIDRINSEKYSDAYDLEGIDKKEINDKEYIWREADIVNSPIRVIDLRTREPLRREVFYDNQRKCLRARIQTRNKGHYFAFELRDTDSNSRPVPKPLTAFERGTNYLLGTNGFPKDIYQAMECFEEDGSAEAYLLIASIFKNEDMYADQESCFEYLMKAVDMGSIIGLIELVLSIVNHETETWKLADAKKILISSLENSKDGENNKIEVANFILGYISEVIDEDLDQSFECFYASASMGYKPSLVRLGFDRAENLKKFDKIEIKRLYVNLINFPNGMMEYCLGSVLYYGLGITRRLYEGLNLLIDSANMGNSEAQNELFEIYDNESSKFFDRKKAFYWLCKAAETKTQMYVTLSNRLLDGIGCARCSENDEKAFNILSKLENGTDRTAINNLGWMYKTGRGCETDYQKALQLFKKAAEMGCPSSYCHLGDMYSDGLGVSPDKMQAHEYYVIAANSGSTRAREILKTWL